MRAINICNPAVTQLDQMFDSQARTMAIVRKHRIRIGAIKETVNENIRFIGQIKGYVRFIRPRFHKNDPIYRPADKLMNRFTFELRVPIRADNDAEIIMLPKVFLNATDQDWGKRAGDVINHKAYCE